MLASNARSGWAGLLCALAAYLLLCKRTFFAGRLRLLLCALICLILVTFLSPLRQKILSRLSHTHPQDPTILHRLGSYPTVQALKGHLSFGVGYGMYPMVYALYYRGPMADLQTPDNQYLRWLIETGLLGFGVLASFLSVIIYKGWQRLRILMDTREADFYKAILAGWIGIASIFLFYDGFYWGAPNMTFWCLLGFYASSLKFPSTPLKNSPGGPQ